MEKGDYVRTPRFLSVRIEKVFQSAEEAYKAGFTEPTHYCDKQYGVYGKSTGINKMIFAGFRK